MREEGREGRKEGRKEGKKGESNAWFSDCVQWIRYSCTGQAAED